ncbi:MAG: hypothetical protein B6I34_09805 [Anaerolineaceae bacterium 4572_32.1]|nr:MAG: hypothetical protein B6I34_09805 [Anaerolineaceae bacterium 4572_32.1]
MTKQMGGRTPDAYQDSPGAVPIALRLIVVVCCVAAVSATIHELREPIPSSTTMPDTVSSPVPPVASPAPAATLPSAPLVVPSVVPSVAATTHIGIVAGHWGNDTGAVCPDGLREVDINLDVAQRVVYLLQALGYQTDLLEEMDSRLEGYRVDALVSIHADSCTPFPDATPPASGFKVASVEDSLVPEAEDRLVACLAQCYAARTGMYFHANSITYDMTRYHTFYEINDQTPAAIIETGFMLNDRPMLTQRADLVAQGIADGIVCFIEGENQ